MDSQRAIGVAAGGGHRRNSRPPVENNPLRHTRTYDFVSRRMSAAEEENDESFIEGSKNAYARNMRKKLLPSTLLNIETAKAGSSS